MSDKLNNLAFAVHKYRYNVIERNTYMCTRIPKLKEESLKNKEI